MLSFPLPSTRFCLEKYSQKTKFPFPGSYEKNSIRSKNIGKLGVNINGDPHFTAPRHPLESKPPSEVECGAAGHRSGIGIDEFFEGKSIFITGATGLVGKALVEKLLRSTSVRKIYLLVKADDEEAALDRLSKEIVDSTLFQSIREKYGSSYKEFVRGKLITIVGNICEPNLGMDMCSAHAIMEKVDVIIGSAANTALNDRYDSLIDSNVNSPQRLMRFATQCKNLKLFVHISTAYVNGSREGVILEKPLVMGENGRDDEMSPCSLPRLDVTDEISLVMKSVLASNKDYDLTNDLKRLGMERAALYGWFNPYMMTKAMGEMVLNEIRGDIPVLIIRPSVIESSYNEPVPGWIQGNRMLDPVIISYGKGHLPAYLADPNAHTDIVPVDLVANTTIAAIAKHGSTDKPGVEVYHAATEFVNPLSFSQLLDYIHEYFSANPLTESKNIKKVKLFSEFEDFSKYTRDEMSGRDRVRTEGGKPPLKQRNKGKIAYVEQLCKMYEFGGFFKARFHTGNTQKLLEEMSKEEQLNFEIDATIIDWRKYFVEIHIPGLRKYVLDPMKVSL